MNVTDWASLNEQRTLASRLLGGRAQTVLADWYETQIDLISDTTFAAEFYGHLKRPGTVQGEYNHRLVRSSRGALLGGIRFFGGDPKRPFVEVFAHSFETDMSALSDMVATEWAAFAPRHLRVLLTPKERDKIQPGTKTLSLDMSIHVAQCQEMARPDGRVSVHPFADVEQAIALVHQRYAALGAQNPELAKNISPESAARLKELHQSGGLHAIQAKEEIVGVLAATPGNVAWINGYEINEEVVATRYQGRGYAAAAQAALAATLEPEALLVGTIDGLNHASRKTANQAGRSAVLGYYFDALAKA